MQRRRWSAEDMAKLQRMAQKYPAQHIAAELGRGLAATMVKAHQLRISLRMKRHRRGAAAGPDPGAAGFDLPTT
jgi:hypothetical protein